MSRRRREYPACSPTLSARCSIVKNEVASRKLATDDWSSEIMEGQCTANASGENADPNFGQSAGELPTRVCKVRAKPMEKTLYSETALEAVVHQPCE